MLRLATRDLAILAPVCNPQELSNSVWALAKLGECICCIQAKLP